MQQLKRLGIVILFIFSITLIPYYIGCFILNDNYSNNDHSDKFINIALNYSGGLSILIVFFVFGHIFIKAISKIYHYIKTGKL